MENTVIYTILLAFAISTILCPMVIPMLQKLKFGQYIREEGPEAHKSKSGTPTMGGIVFLLAFTVAGLVFCKGDKEVLAVIVLTLAFGLIGFLDDYIKVVMKRNLGLRAWQKMGLQFLVTGAFAFYLAKYTKLGTEVAIPFVDRSLDFGVFYWILLFVAILGTVNGSNFTDGLDGLATGVTIVIAVFFLLVSFKFGSNLTISSGALLGALMGFFLFNVNPARVFMGDTGSLALGGFVAGTAYLLQMPIFIVLVAFIYLLEVVSVIIQVLYFKATGGKRFFKMAPIHHHFELCGYAETQVVAGFTIVTVILCLIGLLAL